LPDDWTTASAGGFLQELAIPGELREDTKMTVDDFYYNTVAKQQARELRAEADLARLAKIARTGARQQRAARREARHLEAAVEGVNGLRYAVRSFLARRQAATTTPDRTAVEQTGEPAGRRSAPTGQR